MEYTVVLMFESMIEAPMMRPIREHSNMEQLQNPGNLNSKEKW